MDKIMAKLLNAYRPGGRHMQYDIGFATAQCKVSGICA
jgi:hypothetical protein